MKPKSKAAGRKSKAAGSKLKPAGRRIAAKTNCPQILKVSKRLEGPLELLGGNPCKCECQIGNVSQTIVHMGLDLRGIETHRSMRDALRHFVAAPSEKGADRPDETASLPSASGAAPPSPELPSAVKD